MLSPEKESLFSESLNRKAAPVGSAELQIGQQARCEAFHYRQTGFLLHSLKNGRDALTDADAHCGQAQLRTAVDHIVDERG